MGRNKYSKWLAKALVINTGSKTIFGAIAKSASATVETKFEKGIKDFGYFLMKITLVLSIFILIVNLLNHKSAIESALFALALAVGMAPELLPAITTIAMSAGAKRMLAKKVIVKKLASIQNKHSNRPIPLQNHFRYLNHQRLLLL